MKMTEAARADGRCATFNHFVMNLFSDASSSLWATVPKANVVDDLFELALSFRRPQPACHLFALPYSGNAALNSIEQGFQIQRL